MPTIERRFLALQDFETAARAHLPRPLFGYVSGAAETNAALRDNRAAYEDYALLPRALTNTSKRSQAVTLFGKTYASPFGIAPMGLTAIIAYRGDVVLARSATAENIPMILAGSSLTRLEDVRKEGGASWFQAYLPGEPDRIAALVERVAAAGYENLVLTVDTMVLGNRENNVRNGFTTPLRPSLRLAWDGISHPRWLFGTFLQTLVRHGMPHFENSYATRGAPILSSTVNRDFGARDHLDWRHCEQIRRMWKGRFLLKGVVSPEDARIARESGVDGVIVSNHGGRQLDCMVAPLRALPGVVAAAGDMPVLMDGGIRRGTDVLKAFALGAKMVFIGRPMMYAAAVAGEEGVRHAIHLMRDEVHRDIGLMGLNGISEMTPQKLLRRGT